LQRTPYTKSRNQVKHIIHQIHALMSERHNAMTGAITQKSQSKY